MTLFRVDRKATGESEVLIVRHQPEAEMEKLRKVWPDADQRLASGAILTTGNALYAADAETLKKMFRRNHRRAA